MSLLDVCNKYKTDKGYFFNEDETGGHNFADVYDVFLKEIKDKEIKVLELGIWKGASLLTWNEYFTNAILFGVDIHLEQIDKTLPLGVHGGGWKSLEKHNNINIIKANLGVKQEIINLANKHGNFDLIIDDASHVDQHQRLAITTLWEHLNDGGFYIIEDLHVDAKKDFSLFNSLTNDMKNNSNNINYKYINMVHIGNVVDSITCIIKK